jgi:hypothetical protein
MSTALRAWLDLHSGDIPASLASLMELAVREVDTGADGDATTLSLAAVACMRTALRMGDERAGALHLLAADALITAACEAAADDGAELHTLADRYAPDRLSALFSSES